VQGPSDLEHEVELGFSPACSLGLTDELECTGTAAFVLEPAEDLTGAGGAELEGALALAGGAGTAATEEEASEGTLE